MGFTKDRRILASEQITQTPGPGDYATPPVPESGALSRPPRALSCPTCVPLSQTFPRPGLCKALTDGKQRHRQLLPNLLSFDPFPASLPLSSPPFPWPSPPFPSHLIEQGRRQGTYSATRSAGASSTRAIARQSPALARISSQRCRRVSGRESERAGERERARERGRKKNLNPKPCRRGARAVCSRPPHPPPQPPRRNRR